ncbi:hypothetical protein DFH06DRAFT_1315644 [Mycena polygramma]|nr:hypothetical protein DFH06DRAFT_1315644 [Mycena polygramma]
MGLHFYRTPKRVSRQVSVSVVEKAAFVSCYFDSLGVSFQGRTRDSLSPVSPSRPSITVSPEISLVLESPFLSSPMCSLRCLLCSLPTAPPAPAPPPISAPVTIIADTSFSLGASRTSPVFNDDLELTASQVCLAVVIILPSALTLVLAVHCQSAARTTPSWIRALWDAITEEENPVILPRDPDLEALEIARKQCQEFVQVKDVPFTGDEADPSSSASKSPAIGVFRARHIAGTRPGIPPPRITDTPSNADLSFFFQSGGSNTAHEHHYILQAPVCEISTTRLPLSPTVYHGPARVPELVSSRGPASDVQQDEKHAVVNIQVFEERSACAAADGEGNVSHSPPRAPTSVALPVSASDVEEEEEDAGVNVAAAIQAFEQRCTRTDDEAGKEREGISLSMP